jgi:hypothetical protein
MKIFKPVGTAQSLDPRRIHTHCVGHNENPFQMRLDLRHDAIFEKRQGKLARGKLT